MSEKEQLWYLIDRFLDGSYEVKIFCDEFTRIYDLEVDYDTLSVDERREFGELCRMASRFSDNLDELKMPFVYCSKEQILEKVEKVKYMLRWREK